MAFGGGLGLYHVLGVASCVALVYFSLGELDIHPLSFSFPSVTPSSYAAPTAPFVERRGARLFLDGRPFYVNGWNSYWFMDQAVETGTRHRVDRMFRAAADMGLTVCRTWAFNDGAYNALQLAPGHFDERVFKVTGRSNYSLPFRISARSFAGRKCPLLWLARKRGADDG
jgi:mannan endo-1,4-beta-mannosidase